MKAWVTENHLGAANPLYLVAVQRVAQEIRPYVQEAQIHTADTTIANRSVRLTIVDDTRQSVKAFKLRGAASACLRYAGSTGYQVASSGSFGISVAHMARELKTRARVFVPISIPKVKQNVLQALGAEVVSGFKTYEEAKAAARSVASHENPICPFVYIDGINEAVMEGNGSLGLEILEASLIGPKTAVIVPLGIGSLATPLAQLLGPDVSLISVEPSSHCKMFRALSRDESDYSTQSTELCDGAVVESLPDVASSVLSSNLYAAVAAQDNEVAYAMKLLWETYNIRSEGAGALALSPVLFAPQILRAFDQIVVIITGGNVTDRTFRSVLRGSH